MKEVYISSALRAASSKTLEVYLVTTFYIFAPFIYTDNELSFEFLTVGKTKQSICLLTEWVHLQ